MMGAFFDASRTYWGATHGLTQPQFQGIEFRRYNMSLETQIDPPGSCFSDYTPDKYDRCFAGVHESIQELVCNCPPHDLGRNIPHPDLHDPTSISVDGSTTEDEDEDNGPVYDVGWGWMTSADQLMEQDEDDDPIYNCRASATQHPRCIWG
ncbi:hypothetical protein EDB19DRAFT_1835835 [Suillus lakei]|nr:hypothetical protein EDB19DRAFT_1835835 [Suillus lakei]